MYDSSLGDFTLVNYDNTLPGVNFTATNTGKSLKISFDSGVYNVSGGGLNGTYTTVQFHLHWGKTNDEGSEHTMDGTMFPAEVCYALTLCGSVKRYMMKLITLAKAETMPRKNAPMW